MNPFPTDTPLMRCRTELAKPKYTIDRLVSLDCQKVADHFGVSLDLAKFEREEAIRKLGGKPWELLKVRANG